MIRPIFRVNLINSKKQKSIDSLQKKPITTKINFSEKSDIPLQKKTHENLKQTRENLKQTRDPFKSL